MCKFDGEGKGLNDTAIKKRIFLRLTLAKEELLKEELTKKELAKKELAKEEFAKKELAKEELEIYDQ